MQLYESNSQLRLAANYICYTNKHLFLTGKAGTGKTTFLRNLKNITFKRHVIVAPTGVAAINAGGVTIHSFFQLPFGPQIPEELAKHIATDQKDAKHAASRFQRFTREKANIIKSIDLLVIDEISMVRADMLDAIDAVLRRLRNRETPFGGVQLLMIGDLQQLAPIAKDDEWKLLRDYYDSVYFFSSKALQKTDYVSIELTKIYRQRDEEFINLLGKVRDNKLDADTLAALAKRYIPDFKPNEDEGYITLTTHNYQARDINAYWLNAVKGKEFIYEATIRDEFPEYNYPTEKKLILKAGAQVMFVKNDPSPLKEFFNGKIGKIIRIDDDTIYVKCPDDESPIAVTPLEWHNCRYTLDEQTKEIEETVIGSFTQYPLKLAWAVTIHKSQGLTFNKAIIDARQAFAHGQVYVALSRCRTLGGLVLSTSITPESLKNDYKVGKFIRQLEENVPDENQLQAAKNEFQHSLISELFDFSLFRRRLNYLQKIVRDNIRSFEPGIGEILSLAETNLKIEIIEVAEKFMAQVKWHLGQNPEIEKNETLQDRIKKACQYFTPRFEKIFLKSLPGLESDNKVLRKSANELIQRLLNEALIRLDCLRTCTNGFTVAQYLEARAKSSIEMPASVKKTTEREISAADVAHPKLLKRLKAWRDNHAREQDLTHYQVISRTAIFEIADKLPVSRKELLTISGIGQKKVKKYGSELLAMIEEYIEENALEKAIDFNPLEVEVKEKKPDTKKLSLELFNKGQNIQEIAKDRGLAVSTIEGHLSHFVGTGEIPVHKLISQEQLERITRFFDSAEDFSIGPAKIALGDEVSWGELRIVVNHLEWQRGKDSAKQG